MGRPVILGNGSLTVGINELGLVNDFYYPYVGLDNLANSRSADHMIGVWVDGSFSWIDKSWDISVDFENDALISIITMKNEALKLSLELKDFVDSEFNAFCREITLKNCDATDREIRLFLHQVFQISRAGRADTALFVPDENYILDYKGRCSLLAYAQDASGAVFDQFAVGSYGIEGKEGTFRDAEDGELSGSAVEHGGVDSVMRFKLQLAPDAITEISYWVIAADSQNKAEKIHHMLKKDTLKTRMAKTRQHWQDWLALSGEKQKNIKPEYVTAVNKSLMIIKAHTDKRGGIIASCDSSIYNYGRDYYSYVWPRDGAFVIWPLIRLGYTEEPKKFFEFCRDIITPEGYLMHKYQPDKAIGSTWHPLLHGQRKELAIQEDETAIVLYMIGEFYRHSNDEDFVINLYSTFIQPAANFMAEFIDDQTKLPHASYDLWEEKFLTSTYTTAIVYQALLVAAEFGDKFEYPDDALRWRECAEKIQEGSKLLYNSERQAYRKGFLLQPDGSLQFDNTLDVSSFYGAMMFGLNAGNEAINSTLRVIEKVLLDKSPSGGTARYEHDHYFASEPPYMGNPWFVTTLWVAQYYAVSKQTDKALSYLDWALSHAMPSGALPEQINPTTGQPVSVAPLVWSHAELINTILDV